MLEVADSNKRTSLLHRAIDYSSKKSLQIKPQISLKSLKIPNQVNPRCLHRLADMLQF